MRLITIAGVDRTDDIKLSGFSINQVLTSQEDSCSFVVKSGDAPVSGQEIVVADDSIKLFAGIIDQVKEDHKAGGITTYQCQARDYTFQLDKNLVVETYENEKTEDIVSDILEKYCPDFTNINVKSGAPVIQYIIFDYKRPSECMKELCNYVGWDWFVDYDQDVHFFNPADIADPAPVIIETNTSIRNLKHDIDMQNIRNRVYVRGGTMLSDLWTHEIKADGVTRTWILPHKPHEISIEVGGAAKTVGVENIHDEANFDYMMNYQEKYVRCSTKTTTPTDGTTMTFVYKHNIDVITMVEDLESQAAISTIQGGNGAYEHVIVDESLVTIDAAEAAGNADLKEHANPRVKGSFVTEITGFQTGQLLEINLPDRGIEGVFLVQKVSISPLSTTQWTYRVDYGGRLLGIEDYFRALVSAQQNKDLAETSLLHKFTYGQEKVSISDELETIPRTPPWYCGEEDAVCGFVECSGFFQLVSADGIGILTGYEK